MGFGGVVAVQSSSQHLSLPLASAAADCARTRVVAAPVCRMRPLPPRSDQVCVFLGVFVCVVVLPFVVAASSDLFSAGRGRESLWKTV